MDIDSIAATGGAAGLGGAMAAMLAARGSNVAVIDLKEIDSTEDGGGAHAAAVGGIWTPMWAALPQAAQDTLAEQVPHPSRLGRPEGHAMPVASIVADPLLDGGATPLAGTIRRAPR